MPSFFPNPACLLGSGNAFVIFPQTKRRFIGQRKQGRKSSLCFPTQLKFTSERLQGTKCSPDNLLPKFKRLFFLYIYQKCSSANNSGERPHWAALVWPQEDPTSVLWQKKPPKTPWITQPQSQRLPSSESLIIKMDQLYWRDKNLP